MDESQRIPAEISKVSLTIGNKFVYYISLKIYMIICIQRELFFSGCIL